MNWPALWLTVRLAAATTAILTLLGLPLASWLLRTRWRWRLLIEAFVSLPMVLPPTVLGFYLLWAIGVDGPLGGPLLRWTGLTLPFTFWGLLIGLVIGSMPFAVRPFIAALGSVDRRLIEAAHCLGSSRWSTFWRVVLPLAWPGVLAGMILTFAHAVGEFGIVLMIGGNIEGVTRTLSVTIYDDVQALDYASASRAAGLLLIFAFGVLAAVGLLQRRSAAS